MLSEKLPEPVADEIICTGRRRRVDACCVVLNALPEVVAAHVRQYFLTQLIFVAMVLHLPRYPSPWLYARSLQSPQREMEFPGQLSLTFAADSLTGDDILTMRKGI